MKTFLICPVRGYHPMTWKTFVNGLEIAGWKVHWPTRDTDQHDPTGLRICKQNREAIREADAVHVIWDGESTGVLFDLGMAFALGKRVIILALPEAPDVKSFLLMIRAWASENNDQD